MRGDFALVPRLPLDHYQRICEQLTDKTADDLDLEFDHSSLGSGRTSTDSAWPSCGAPTFPFLEFALLFGLRLTRFSSLLSLSMPGSPAGVGAVSKGTEPNISGQRMFGVHKCYARQLQFLGTCGGDCNTKQLWRILSTFNLLSPPSRVVIVYGGWISSTCGVNPVVTDAVMLWRAMFAPASVSPIDRSDQARVEALNSLAVRGVAGVSQDPRPPPEETMLLGCFRLVLDDVSTRRSLSISTWL
ncbi:hypothetical protein QR685DRAFT_524400 [Neurospora intermedia]|uniref:Uncharacterized protein n=1 Tax=Neurospora intermedia TaxID=5142 RepID=A0ABR3DEB5_NEUIN